MKTIRKVMFMGLLLLLALPMAAQRKVKFTIAEKATEQRRSHHLRRQREIEIATTCCDQHGW